MPLKEGKNNKNALSPVAGGTHSTDKSICATCAVLKRPPHKHTRARTHARAHTHAHAHAHLQWRSCHCSSLFYRFLLYSSSILHAKWRSVVTIMAESKQAAAAAVTVATIREQQVNRPEQQQQCMIARRLCDAAVVSDCISEELKALQQRVHAVTVRVYAIAPPASTAAASARPDTRPPPPPLKLDNTNIILWDPFDEWAPLVCCMEYVDEDGCGGGAEGRAGCGGGAAAAAAAAAAADADIDIPDSSSQNPARTRVRPVEQNQPSAFEAPKQAEVPAPEKLPGTRSSVREDRATSLLAAARAAVAAVMEEQAVEAAFEEALDDMDNLIDFLTFHDPERHPAVLAAAAAAAASKQDATPSAATPRCNVHLGKGGCAQKYSVPQSCQVPRCIKTSSSNRFVFGNVKTSASALSKQANNQTLE